MIGAVVPCDCAHSKSARASHQLVPTTQFLIIHLGGETFEDDVVSRQRARIHAPTLSCRYASWLLVGRFLHDGLMEPVTCSSPLTLSGWRLQASLRDRIGPLIP